ncbi:MAG: response regulator [Deltaproteobacteria bacterium]|nr:MAG: response regulator [Deltaproteobacteria bacterium]
MTNAQSTPSQIKLLVVDDEVDFLNTLSQRLKSRDFQVTTASNGNQAIQEATGEFDVAILDLKMPGMDGQELLKILKENHKFLEIIMLTGYASVESAVECTKLGAFGYLEKPYDLEKLMAVLRDAYETRLKKKFPHDQKRMKELDTLATGDPMAALRAMMRLDDLEK